MLKVLDQDNELLDRIYWHGEYWPVIAGGAEDDADPDADKNDDGDDTDDDSSDDTDDDSSDGDIKDGKGKTFSQKEVDRIAARSADKAKRGKIDPKEFGFTNRKDLEEFLTSAKEKAEEAKTEAERALEAAKKTAADEARAEVLTTANERLLKAEFKLAALKYKVAHTDDAFQLAQGLEGWDEVKVDDDGNVTGLDKEFFTELRKSKPFLFETEGKGDGDDGDIDGGAGAGGKQDKYSEGALKKQFPALASLSGDGKS